jgi:oligoendopeptidase F
VHHFNGAPGCVHAYAFEEPLVLALCVRYQEAGPTFVPAYLQMLTSGGSNRPHELVKPVGVEGCSAGLHNVGCPKLTRPQDLS